ncbi:hypothetical protein ElyMa_006434400 [Elysia marginata]|uniref:EGF-like domain-containing protein n=1 Tax=Elysia marginata TaxID=1093978 RepID=A0AAV4HVJ4_9GAST|nr:hypothetical protein ElyMa_006434400 [Elysia marginata]
MIRHSLVICFALVSACLLQPGHSGPQYQDVYECTGTCLNGGRRYTIRELPLNRKVCKCRRNYLGVCCEFRTGGYLYDGKPEGASDDDEDQYKNYDPYNIDYSDIYYGEDPAPAPPKISLESGQDRVSSLQAMAYCFLSWCVHILMAALGDNV